MLAADGGGAAIDAIGKSMADFAAGAASGAFAISPTGGDALITAIRDLREWVDIHRDDVAALGDEPMLGSSHAAETMKQFVPKVALDNQGFVPMLLKFRESLVNAEQGIRDAMANYHGTDQGSASGFQQ